MTTGLTMPPNDNMNKNNSKQVMQKSFFTGQSCKKSFNPCKNNAICKQYKIASLHKQNNSTTRIRLHCFCPDGFKGKYCEEDINECEFNPCTSDSVCINTYGSYMCNCSQSPSSLCYNSIAPKYLDLKSQMRKNGNKLTLNYEDGIEYEINELNYENEQPIVLLGAKIPNYIVQQVILGVFGGLCALLIVLSILAGVVCKINMSNKRKMQRDRLVLSNADRENLTR